VNEEASNLAGLQLDLELAGELGRRDVDRLRAEAGLGPLADYLAQMKAM
jgi:hypothetical protein